MSLKAKGIRGERDLVHKFWAAGWACLRIAGSGSSRYPSPDILAGKGDRRLAIECKVTKDDKKYFDKDSIEKLDFFANVFGAQPWVAIKFQSEPWVFLRTSELEATGASFLATKEKAKLNGLLFDEVSA
ncbi:Holliday junction resolvase [Candidatus Woesearchaeota archaeon]|nr:Holliday junction resolvase [Candidatus Woesearchaeota archaeon]